MSLYANGFYIIQQGKPNLPVPGAVSCPRTWPPGNLKSANYLWQRLFVSSPHREHSRKIEPSPKRERASLSRQKCAQILSRHPAAGKAPEQQDRTFHEGISSSGWRPSASKKFSLFSHLLPLARVGKGVFGKFVKGGGGLNVSLERGRRVVARTRSEVGYFVKTHLSRLDRLSFRFVLEAMDDDADDDALQPVVVSWSWTQRNIQLGQAGE